MARLAARRLVQRYWSHQVGWGGQEFPTFQARRALGLAGFQPGSANRGWIRIRDAAGAVRLQQAVSQHGLAHTEELLLQWALAPGGLAAQASPPAALAVAPDAPGNAPRVLELYTERQPCTAATADAARAGRPRANCHTMLSQLLHDDTPVHWSVPNTLADHNALMFRHVQRHITYTETARLRAAVDARAAALAGGPFPLLEALHDHWHAQLVGMAAPTVLTFNAWHAQMTATATAGIAAINAWAPPVAALPVPVPQ